MTDNTKNGIHNLFAFYGRVSTSLQEDQKTIENQIMAMKDFVEKKFGNGNYTIVKEYYDEGWSGDNLERPELDQLRLDAKKKIWDAVLIYDPDRLARRSAWQEVVMEELKDLRIDVLFVTVPKAKNDEESIMYKMRGVFTEYERMKIKERFRLGKLRKVQEGHILITEPLYGYNYIPNVKLPNQPKVHGYYKTNEEEAKVVRKIFSWVGGEGVTLRGVVRKLQELGIKPRKSKRGVWSTSTLSTMLRNKAYIGEARWGSSYAVVPENPLKDEKYKKNKKTSRKIKPEEEWIASKIPVPPIIDKDLFSKVRSQLKTNLSLSQRNTKNEYLLGGKIFCTCGTKRCGEGPQKGKHLYYRCSNRVYNFPLPPTCKEGGINARTADRLVWQRVTELATSPELLLQIVNQWVDEREQKRKSPVQDIGAIEKNISKLKAQVDRYNKAYGAEVFSLEQLREYTAPLKKQMEELKAQINTFTQEERSVSSASLPREEEIRIFTEEISGILADLNFEEKRAIMGDTIGKVTGTQRELLVLGQIPLSLINHVKQQTIHRNCRASERWEIDAV